MSQPQLSRCIGMCVPLLVCAAAVLVHTFGPPLYNDPASTCALGQGCWRITVAYLFVQQLSKSLTHCAGQEHTGT